MMQLNMLIRIHHSATLTCTLLLWCVGQTLYPFEGWRWSLLGSPVSEFTDVVLWDLTSDPEVGFKEVEWHQALPGPITGPHLWGIRDTWTLEDQPYSACINYCSRPGYISNLPLWLWNPKLTLNLQCNIAMNKVCAARVSGAAGCYTSYVYFVCVLYLGATVEHECPLMSTLSPSQSYIIGFIHAAKQFLWELET